MDYMKKLFVAIRTLSVLFFGGSFYFGLLAPHSVYSAPPAFPQDGKIFEKIKPAGMDHPLRVPRHLTGRVRAIGIGVLQW